MKYKKLKNSWFLIWVLLICTFIFIKGIKPALQNGSSDFYNYYVASKLLVQGEPISQFYDNDFFATKAEEIGLSKHTKFAPFPPLTAFLYLPLSVFSPSTAKVVWLVINLMLLVVVVYQLKSISNLSLVEVLFTLSLFCIPIANNFRLGQSYLFITMLILYYINTTKTKKSTLASGLLGLATALKYFPFTYLFYSKPVHFRKHLIGFTLGFGLLVVLPILTDGIQVYSAFISHFINHLNGNLEVQGQFSYTFQSIDALLANLFIYDASYNKNPLIDLASLKPLLKGLFTLTILAVTVKVYKREKGWSNNSIGTFIIALAILLPASASYHLLLLIPAVFLLIKNLPKENTKLKVMLLVLVFITCNVLPHHIPTLNNSHILNTIVHFPRLYGLIAIFVLLLYAQKKPSIKNG